jgi:hypothetical protein
MAPLENRSRRSSSKSACHSRKRPDSTSHQRTNRKALKHGIPLMTESLLLRLLLGEALTAFLSEPDPLKACLILKQRHILLFRSASDILRDMLTDALERGHERDEHIIYEHLTWLRLARLKGIDQLIQELRQMEDDQDGSIW